MEALSIIQSNTPICPQSQEIIVITGYSGAGKSTVLRALEDIGFFCVDNLPIALVSQFFELIEHFQTTGQRVALGIDIRAGSNLELLAEKIGQAKKSGLKITVFFLATELPVLLKRFQETRRNHPLGSNTPISELIDQERKILEPLSALADVVVDTDQCTPNQLRTIVRSYFAQDKNTLLVVHLISFGYKYGVPSPCNFVYDVRSLPNPYFIEKYRPLDGTNDLLREFFFGHSEVQEYWLYLTQFIDFSIKKIYSEGRSFVTIAIGCTGGRHRSVALVHQLAQREMKDVVFVVKHRDIDRESMHNVGG
ncbi:MAG: glmZ(sRNA)-inactivating NTPase [Candidatus Dependentiae bacterium ADurb.Bin331]|nr:MAG: glmZ(sRNA)-inactivating NTPase [Candidatus Dependentiae bacterium ADurb.Bin331]